MNKRISQVVLPLVGLGVVAAALSGCGGASTNSGAASVATPDSGPAIYGLNALALVNGASTQGETSGLSFTPAGGTAEAVAIAATGYTTLSGAGPLPAYQASFPNTGTSPVSSAGVPLGFFPGALYYNDPASTVIAALPTTYAGNLVFGAYISPSQQNGSLTNLNTGSVVLTSSEAPAFSVPLTFDPTFGGGVLSQAQYKTAPFPMPAFLQTTGLHNLHAVVSDTGSPVQSGATDFSVLSLAPTDSAVLIPVEYANAGNTTFAVVGATATITNALPNVAAYKDSTAPTGANALPTTTSYSDAQGMILLFAAPGTQTITVSGVNPDPKGTGTVSATFQVTLTAGVVDTVDVAHTTVSAAPASVAAIARAKLLSHRK